MTDTPQTEPDGDAPDPPPPAATDDATEDPPRRRRYARRVVAIVAVWLAVVLVAVGVLGTRVARVWGPAASVAMEVTPPEPTESAPPSPFAGTPAEDFAEGADGIVLPEAEPVGDFTAGEVADALEQVRDALIAARLDPTMLVDHDPDPFLSLLAPDHRPGREAQFDSGEFVSFATQLVDDAAPAPAAPRVAGRMTYGAKTVEGDLPVIEVVTGYVWVYAFDEPARTIVIVRDEAVWELRSDEHWLESSRGLWLAGPASGVWGADCETYDDGLLGPAAGPTPDPGDDAGEIFDPEQPLEQEGGC